MSVDILDQVKLTCKQYGIDPKRSKGQNFLVSQEIIEKMIAAAQIGRQDTILEVGSGLGILTEALIKKAKKVISVELDKKLFDFLKLKFADIKNLELINDDILKANPVSYKLKAESYKIVASLPYNITSHFLKKFLTGQNRPTEMTLLLQKEVAQRICAKPGKMSLLSLSVQLYGQPEIIEIVPKDNFWPIPKVDSAILKIKKIKGQKEIDKILAGISEKFFWQVARIGFSARRKQLQNNLASGFSLTNIEAKKLLKKANFDPRIRAQDLGLNDWLSLTRAISSHLN